MNKKIKFLYFESEDGKKVKSIQINIGNLNLNEWLDDIEAEMNIINGDIEFTILNQHYYDKDELKGIQSELRNINWNGGYEFIDFINIQTNETYFLFGDKNSDIFNQINSPQNINNINNFAKRINGEYGK